mgnify:CR=1 FL=1
MNFKKLKIALVGNPNCGKTAIFNALTGSKQRVANYPGVTVEKKHGFFTTPAQVNCTLIDKEVREKAGQPFCASNTNSFPNINLLYWSIK